MRQLQDMAAMQRTLQSIAPAQTEVPTKAEEVLLDYLQYSTGNLPENEPTQDLGFSPEAIDDYRRRYPKRTDSLTDLGVAKMIKAEDQTHQPEHWINATLSEVANVPFGFASEYLNAGLWMNEGVGAMADLVGLDELADYQYRIVDEGREFIENETLVGIVAKDGGPGVFAGQVLGNVVPGMGAIRGGKALRGAAYLYYAMSAFGAGVEDYRDTILEQGGDPGAVQAVAVGAGYAAIEFVTEKAGIDIVGRKIGPDAARRIGDLVLRGRYDAAAKAMGGIIGVGATGGAEEALAQLAQNVTALTFDPDRPLSEGVAESFGAGVLGGEFFLGAALVDARIRRMGKPLSERTQDSILRPENEEQLRLAKQAVLLGLPAEAQVAAANRAASEVERRIKRHRRTFEAMEHLEPEERAEAIEELKAILDDNQQAPVDEIDRSGVEMILELLERLHQKDQETDPDAKEKVTGAQLDAEADQPSFTREQRREAMGRLLEAMNVRRRDRRGKEPLEVSEREALRASLSAQVRAARAADQEARRQEKAKAKERITQIQEKARRELEEAKQQTQDAKAQARVVIGAIKELGRIARQQLPKPLQGKVLPLIEKIQPGAKDPLKQLSEGITKLRDAMEQHETNEVRKELRKIWRSLRVDRLRPEFKELVQKQLEGYQISEPSKSKRMELEAAAAIIERHQNEHGLPDGVAGQLRRLTDKSIAKMDREEAQQLIDALSFAIRANELVNRIVNQQRNMELNEAVTIVNDEIDRTGFLKQRRVLRSGKLEAQQRETWWKLPLSMIGNMDQDVIAEALGGQDSFTWQVLYDDIRIAKRNQLIAYYEDKDALLRILRRHGYKPGSKSLASMDAASARKYSFLGALLRGRPSLRGDTKARIVTFQTEAGEMLRMTPMQRAYLMALMMDPFAYQQVTGRTQAPVHIDGQAAGKNHHLTKEDARRLLNPEDAEGQQLLAFTRDLMDYLTTKPRDRMREWSVDKLGYDITRDGYYVPIHRIIEGTDPKQLLEDESYYAATIEGAGISKHRIGGNRPIKIPGLLEEFNNYSWISSQLTQMGPAIRAARQIITSKPIQEQFKNTKQGKRVQTRIRERFEEMAREALGAPPPSDISQEALGPLIGRMGVALLGLNFRVGLYQPASIFPMVRELGPLRLAAAFAKMTAGGRMFYAKQIMQEMNQSAELRNRFEGSIIGLVHGGGGGTTRLANAPRHWTDHVMAHISYFDRQAIKTAYMAAKSEARSQQKAIEKENARITRQNAAREANGMPTRELLPTLSDADVINMALHKTEMTVHRTQPTFDALHATGLGIAARRNKAFKAVNLYRSQRNKNMNMSMRSIMRINRAIRDSQMSKAEKSKVIAVEHANIAAIWLAQPLWILAVKWLWQYLRAGVGSLLAGESPGKAFDRITEKELKTFGVKYVEIAAGTPLFGDFIGWGVNRLLFPETRRFEPTMSPISSLVNDVLFGGAALIDGIQKGEIDPDDVMDAIFDGAVAAAALSGAPVAAVREIEAIHDEWKKAREDERRYLGTGG
jgi:hypothetical protein